MTKQIEYQYNGARKIVLDDHNPEFEIDVVKGDKFRIVIGKTEVSFYHEDEPKTKFVLKFVDKKYQQLMKNSEQTTFVFVPHPTNPSYPQLGKIDLKLVEKLYDHYNETLFNGKCPSVVFRATTGMRGAIGLAEYAKRQSDGRRSYRLSIRMDYAKNDPHMFIDVLIHEMIHLYLFKIGADTNSAEHLHSAHGPLFMKEVNRVNAKGFHVSQYLDWEKRETVKASDDLYLLVMHMDQGLMAAFWSLTKPTVEQLNSVLDQHRGFYPEYGAKATLYQTRNTKIRSKLPELKRTFKLPARGYVFAPHTVVDDAQAVLHTEYKPPAAKDTSVKIKLSKRDLPYLALTLDEYKAAVRRHLVADYGNAEAAWMSVTVKQVEPVVLELLKSAHAGYSRGMKDKEVQAILKEIPDHYTPRFTDSVYRKSVKDLIAKHKLQGLENFRELRL